MDPKVYEQITKQQLIFIITKIKEIHKGNQDLHEKSENALLSLEQGN